MGCAWVPHRLCIGFCRQNSRLEHPKEPLADRPAATYPAAMTPTTVTLPDSLKAFVDQQVAAGGYNSPGEYLRDLIRRDRDRQALRGLLLDGLASGPGEVVDDAWFDALRADIRDAGAA